MPYSILSHTADTGVEATAGTLADLIEELATAMFHLMADTEAATSAPVTVEVAGTDPGELVVDVLSELLYLAEVEALLFTRFEAVATPGGIAMSASGCPVADVELTGAPIKAVTYHGLVAEESDGVWHGRVYFDV